MSEGLERTVLVVQRRLTHYRVPFFEVLRKELASRGINLLLAHGSPTREEADKRDGGELCWAHRLKTAYFLGGRICWQPFDSLARRSDLVVVAHENKLLWNLALQYGSMRSKVVLWGHGANLQGDSLGWRERFKRHTARQADWWLAYTRMSVPLIERSGFPSDRITVLNNAIDTIGLSDQRAAVTPGALAELRRALSLSGRHVGVFIGSLYSEKRIDFLLEAAVGVRDRVPGFELLIVGDGRERRAVETFCKSHSWARYLGVRSGKDKAELLALAKVILNPGLVGLGILDSFVCGVPMVTTDCGLHSPEIAYLETGQNGIMTEDNLSSYVEAVARVLLDSVHQSSLSEGCARSASAYTIEGMARNFSDGVERCLSAPRCRRTT